MGKKYVVLMVITVCKLSRCFMIPFGYSVFDAFVRRVLYRSYELVIDCFYIVFLFLAASLGSQFTPACQAIHSCSSGLLLSKALG